MVSKVAKLLKDRSQDKRRRIEAAALALFTTQGFHGTNNREIAKRAGVSTAAIYTHYASKEALFIGLVEQHRALVAKWLRKTIVRLGDSRQDAQGSGVLPADLHRRGRIQEPALPGIVP
jgi:AcrR family transcriptional regulator